MSSKRWLLLVIGSIVVSSLASAVATTAVQGRSAGKAAPGAASARVAARALAQQHRHRAPLIIGTSPPTTEISASMSRKAKPKARSAIRYSYFESVVKTGAEDGGSIDCPKSAPRAIGGFFVPKGSAGAGQIALTDSVPLLDSSETKARSWDIGVRNLSSVDQPYFGGVVCSG